MLASEWQFIVFNILTNKIYECLIKYITNAIGTKMFLC